MRIMLRFVPLVVAMLCGCAVKPAPPAAHWPQPASGTFLSDQGTPISLDSVLATARDMDFVLLGEGHTNLCDHAVQAQILEGLARQGHRFTIGLEMLPVTAQPALDRFNAQAFPPAQLEQETEWRTTWGHSFQLYEPLFEIAARYNLPVVALNLPRPVLHAARDGREHTLPDHERAMLPKRLMPVSEAQQKALREQADMHHAMRPPGEKPDSAAAPAMSDMAAKFFLVQALWDSSMAERAVAQRVARQRPVVILAGAGHVEHGWGIASRILALNPEATILGVVPVRDAEDFAQQTSPDHPTLAGELLYFYCAAQHRSRLGMNVVFEDRAIRVTEIIPGSAADKADLRPDDVLIASGDKPLTSATDLHFAAMAAARSKQPLALTVRRGAQTLQLALPLE